MPKIIIPYCGKHSTRFEQLPEKYLYLRATRSRRAREVRFLPGKTVDKVVKKTAFEGERDGRMFYICSLALTLYIFVYLAAGRDFQPAFFISIGGTIGREAPEPGGQAW